MAIKIGSSDRCKTSGTPTYWTEGAAGGGANFFSLIDKSKRGEE